MIDLHSHTNESDGTDSPAELIEKAHAVGLRALAITDHDTFAGSLAADARAGEIGIELVRGIELSTKLDGLNVHMLAYFLSDGAPVDIAEWVGSMVARRRERNVVLARRLQGLGLKVELADAEALGRTITGRVHFARVLVAAGYVRSVQQAFDRYLGEEAPGYVAMDDPPVREAIDRVRNAGGVIVVAHPGRLRVRDLHHEERVLRQMVDEGMNGIEVIHSEHSIDDALRFERFAKRWNLARTGGSDYHGTVKPGIRLGEGYGNVRVPDAWLAALREAARK